MNLVLVSFANGSDHQRYTTYICNHMTEKNNNVFLICSSSFNIKTLNSNIRVNNSIPCEKTRIESQSLQFKKWLIVFRQLLDFKPDLIHFITAHPLNFFVNIGYWFGKKWFTIHDVNPHPEERVGIAIRIYNEITKRIAHKIIVHSMLAKQQLGVFQSKASVMPLAGVERLNVSKGLGTNVLFFGRIKPYKGVDLFIDAAECVLNEFPGVHFVIAGEGTLDETIKKIKHKQNFTIVNRFINEQEVSQLFNECQFVVLPYKSATQSGIIPLAYSYCRPVIGTRVGAIPEMLEHRVSGLICEPDIDSLSNAMKYLLRDPSLCNSLAEGARTLYQKQFSAQNMSEAFEKLYNTVDNN